MNLSVTQYYPNFSISFRQTLFAALLVLLIGAPIFAQAVISQPDENTMIVEDAGEMEIFAIGKTVIVKKRAKGVLSLGGDVIIEGRVTEDVAAIGGSVTQKKDAFIGGDVFVFGGTYSHDDAAPQRNAGKETIMIAAFEDELRSLMQNPSRIFAPDWSWSFFAQRLLSVLFWFIVSLVLTTLAPGAVSRAAARFQLSALKVFAIGLPGIFIMTFGVLASNKFLPGYLTAVACLMAFVLLMLAYVFGRVALQVNTGKWILKKIFPRKSASETSTLLTGAFVWTLFLSVPYLWTFALFVLLAASLGIVLTARSENSRWRKA